MRMRNIILLLAGAVILIVVLFWALSFLSTDQTGEPMVEEDLSYRIEEVPLPQQMIPEISAVTFTPAGRLVVANRRGEIWIRELDGESWRRFAYGLHIPLGLKAKNEDAMYVSQKPEITYLEDSTGDGIADMYKTVVDEWGISDNWHENTYGLPQDEDGNFVFALGLADQAGLMREEYPRFPLDRDRVLDESKLSVSPWQGWVLKAAPSGDLIPWGSGFRQPFGVAVSPDDDIFITNQQGDWVGSSSLIHVKEGQFYGHPASLKWDERYADETISVELLEEIRTPESVVLPHGSMGGSPGKPVWDTTEGAFGPFANQVFIGDFTKLIMRVDLEKINGEYQGAVFPFIRDVTGVEAVEEYSGGDNLTRPAGEEGRIHLEDVPPRPGTPLRQGNMKMAFAPDGSLYIGQTTRDWAKAGDGMQRIVWSGRTPTEIRTMRLTERGFELNFTTRMDSELADQPDTYRMSRFRYLYNSGYGSPRVDQANVQIVETNLSENGERVELIVDELIPGFIYRLEVDELSDVDGRLVENPLAYYTLNRTLDGEQFEGRLSERIFEEPEVERDGPDFNRGRQIYSTYCVSCHMRDGSGGDDDTGFSAPDFTDDESLLRTKTDNKLFDYIAGEKEETLIDRTMPSFGNTLNDQEIKDVLHFINTRFKPE